MTIGGRQVGKVEHGSGLEREGRWRGGDPRESDRIARTDFA